MERISFSQIPSGITVKLMDIENLITASTLDYQLLEILRLRIAQINKCAYCIDMHYKELKQIGETELRMYSLSIWRETSYFSEKEEVALEFTEALTLISENNISDNLFTSLTNFFNTEEICTLTLAISQLNTWTRLVKTFKLTPGVYEVTK